MIRAVSTRMPARSATFFAIVRRHILGRRRGKPDRVDIATLPSKRGDGFGALPSGEAADVDAIRSYSQRLPPSVRPH